MAVGGSSSGRRRPAISRLRVGTVRVLTGLRHVRRLLHRRTSESGSGVGFAHAGLGVHALDGGNTSQRRVACWLLKLRLTRLWARVV